jgi:hypothetical protein
VDGSQAEKTGTPGEHSSKVDGTKEKHTTGLHQSGALACNSPRKFCSIVRLTGNSEKK